MPKAKIGVIGGSGLYEIEGITAVKELTLDTPFGKPSDTIVVGKLSGVGVAFLPRHGRGHRIPPTDVPFRANIYALKSLGVERIIAITPSAVSQKVSNPATSLFPTSSSTALRVGCLPSSAIPLPSTFPSPTPSARC